MRVVRVIGGEKVVEDPMQVIESSIVPAFGEQGEVSRLEKVLVVEIPGQQDNSGGKSLASFKAFG